MIVSLMVPCEEEAWKSILKRVEETGADGVELNFGCPHGMPERGMGAAVGQVPEYVEMVTRWFKKNSRIPVIVKLTLTITRIIGAARPAVPGGAHEVYQIKTNKSHVNLDQVRKPTRWYRRKKNGQ